MTTNKTFQWARHPKAEELTASLLEECCGADPSIEQLKQDLAHHTSTRLFDWVDHLVIASSAQQEVLFEELGFTSEAVTASYRVLHHPAAQLPRIVVRDHGPPLQGVAVAVESIADFLMVRGISSQIEGTPYSSYRRCCLSNERGVSLWIIERRCGSLIEPSLSVERYAEKYLEAQEIWQTRPRDMQDEEEAMAHTFALGERVVGLVGQDLAAWIVLDVERRYWQARNHAAQIQKNRQDRLGMGWANHDHHTFRSSRHLFPYLLRFFEMLGFTCRERFYAGKEAGWGAQVMEHPRTRLVLFLDVDLEEHELGVDFRHQLLSRLEKHRIVGLWCALHGDSLLKAGMHHLEAQFSFDELKRDLNALGVEMMDPFSQLPYLHQAFTKGEIWPVDPWRIDKLLREGEITREQADQFRTHGALGSHLENLQRKEGYKGFNQRSVSDIIRRTDPRTVS